MNTSNENKNFINKKKYYPLFILLILFLSLTVMFYFSSKKVETTSLSYKETGDFNYSVCLKENDTFQDQCLEKDKQYISDLIDYININFNYQIFFEDNVDVNYSYSINAITTIQEDSEKNKIYDENIESIFNKFATTELDSKLITIDNNNIKIDFQSYNKIARGFRNLYKVRVKSYLKLLIEINLEISHEKFTKSFKKNVIMTMIIPLDESSVNIDTSNNIKISSNDKSNGNSFIEKFDYDGNNNLYFIISILSFIISFIILFFILFSYRKDIIKIKPYYKFMKNINNKYGEIITIADQSFINENEYTEIIDVLNFNELFDHANAINKTILLTEFIKKDVRGNEVKVAWFTVKEEKRLYRKIYTELGKERDFK